MSTLSRYHKRKNDMHRYLGGKCVSCSSTENLFIHHKKPEDKGFDLTTGFSRPWNIIIEELKKCELLCKDCHDQQTHIHKQRNKPKQVYNMKMSDRLVILENENKKLSLKNKNLHTQIEILEKMNLDLKDTLFEMDKIVIKIETENIKIKEAAGFQQSAIENLTNVVKSLSN